MKEAATEQQKTMQHTLESIQKMVRAMAIRQGQDAEEIQAQDDILVSCCITLVGHIRAQRLELLRFDTVVGILLKLDQK